MEAEIDVARMATLRALCDTFAAPVRPPAVEADDPTGFWGRTASDLGVHRRVARTVLEDLEPDDRDGMLELLDALGRLSFARLPRGARVAVVRTLGRLDEGAADGLDAYRGLTLLDFYGRAVDGRDNPNWEQLGYPGPPAAEPGAPSLEPFVPAPEDGSVEIAADVVVVGSGSGGGVIAGVLAEAGLDVLVLEAGGHREDADFPLDEPTALEELYWRGGVQTTVDGNVAILAGATLGGGSTINWQNCVATPDAVRAEWATEHGLKDLDTSAWDAHVDAVSERIGATDECSDLNGPNQRLADGADALGYSWHAATRNTDPASYTPETAGHVGFGDRTGSKQGTLKTYLRDAAGADARIMVRAHADRILVEDGVAAGVEATWSHPVHGPVRVTVRAPRVVAACGALETPALLLRSGIGGPAVGRHLRVHPVPNIGAFYPEPQAGWWGPPQACIVDEFATYEQGHGFLIETPHFHPGITAAVVPWTSARDHKLVMGRMAHLTSFLAVTRERGGGSVEIDDRGRAVLHYPLDDPFDRRMLSRAVEIMVRLHVAAGAETIIDLHPDGELWRRGQDPDHFAAVLAGKSLGDGGRVLFSAHQMGTARMGTDPAASVADPAGQLHDTAGVWVGDTSAFPTAVGSNPMLTCMALARRTAHAIIAAT